MADIPRIFQSEPQERRLRLPQREREPVAPEAPREPLIPQQPPLDPAVPKAAEKSVGGFAKNYVEDAVTNIKDISRFIFVGIPKFVWETVKDPAARGNQIAGLVSYDTLPKLWDAISHNYKNGLWEAIYTKPFSVTMDAAAVLSLGGGALAKLGGVGRLERAMAEVGKMDQVSKLGRVGLAVEGSAGSIDPIMLLGRGIGVAAKPLLTSLGFGEHTKVLRHGESTIRASEAMAKAKTQLLILKKNLSPADQATLHKALFRGAQADIDALSPAARERLENWRQYAEVPQSAAVGPEGKRFLSQKTMDEAKVRGASWAEFGDTTADHMAVARENIKTGTWNPTFASMYRVGDPVDDLFEAMNRELSGNQAWGRLERRGPNGEYETNPDVYMFRQLEAFHDAQFKLKFMDYVQGEMGRQGKLRVVKRNDPLPEGYARLKEGLYKKYWQDYTRVQAAALSDAARTGSIEEAVVRSVDSLSAGPTGTMERLERSESLVAEGKRLRALGQRLEDHDIVVPKDVAAYVNRVMQVPGHLTRLYDRALGVWKPLVTLFNPKYWGSVVGGNAGLGLLYGIKPSAVLAKRSVRDGLPARLQAILATEFVRSDLSTYSRLTNRLGAFAARLDTFLKQSAYVNDVLPAVKARIMGIADPFFKAADDAADALAYVSRAPDRYVEALLDIQKSYEQLSARIPKISEVQRALGVKERALKSVYLKINKGVRSFKAAPRPQWSSMADVADNPGRMAKLQNMRKALEAEVGVLEESLKTLRAEGLNALGDASQLRSALPRFSADAEYTNKMIDNANRLTGSLSLLHPFERNVVRRLVPFYTFAKAMTALAFRMPFFMPKRTFMWNRLSKMWVDAITEDETLPDWTRDYMPVATDAEGNVVMVRLGSMSPWAGVRLGAFGDSVMPSLLDVPEQNPVIKLVFALKGGANQWSKRPMSPGEYATRLDNGVVVQYDNGRFKTTIAQPTLWRSLWYMFPQAQMIESVLMPYMQTDRGWFLNPEPILRPDGSVAYPKELLDGLLSFVGVPTVTRIKPEEMALRERRRTASVIKSYVGDMRFASPEKRIGIRQVLSDWSSGKTKKLVER